MLNQIKAMMLAEYGDRWLNSVENQNGMAEDLTILEQDMTRLSRKFGIQTISIHLTKDREIVARYEVLDQVQTLYEIDAVFYSWWGNRASENISCVEREIADDDVIYHFLTGTPTHGHSGCVILTGREVRRVISRRRDRRLEQLSEFPDYAPSQSAPFEYLMREEVREE